MRLFSSQLSFLDHLFVRPPSPFSSTDGELREVWAQVQSQFFPDRSDILDYDVRWSPRVQKRVLGSCNMTYRRVRIARAMDRPELSHLLEALIYHEMCHAVVGVNRTSGGRRVFHGKEFRSLERSHPQSKLLDQWIRAGGWQRAVRSYSATLSQKERRARGRR